MRVSWETIPDGDLGTSATLARMRALVDEAQRDPLVVQTARRITEGAQDDLGRVELLVQWLRRHYRFVKDPVGYELLAAPRGLIEDAIRQGAFHGDCDDVVTLAAAVAESVGIETRFRVLAPDRGPASQARGYTHVVVEFAAGGEWLPVDFTIPDAPIGWAPQGARQAVSRGGQLMAYTQVGYYRPRRTLGQDLPMPEWTPPPILAPEPAPETMTVAEQGWLQQVVGGVQSLATTALPFLERYGILEPERGPYRLPLPGEPSAAYAAYGYFPPGAIAAQAQQWAPVLLLGGGALLVFLLMGRRRT